MINMGMTDAGNDQGRVAITQSFKVLFRFTSFLFMFFRLLHGPFAGRRLFRPHLVTVKK